MTNYDRQVTELMMAKKSYILLGNEKSHAKIIRLSDDLNDELKQDHQIKNDTEPKKNIKREKASKPTNGLGLSLDDILIEESSVAGKAQEDKKLFFD
jgi:hypothetical protein